MANEWYYAKDGQQLGPVSAKELKSLADSGQLRGDDLVWKDGMPDWKPAGQIKGLVSGQPAGAPSASTGGASPRRRRGRYRSPLGQVLLIIAGVLLIAQMCVPWWSMTLTNTDSDDDTSRNGVNRRRIRNRRAVESMMFALFINMSDRQIEDAIDRLERSTLPPNITDKQRRARQNQIRFLKIAKSDRKWWKTHLKSGDESFAKRLVDKMREAGDSEGSKATLSIWGWNEGVSIMALVFGIVVLIAAIVFISVPLLRNWSWIVSIIAAIMGIIVLIFALIWIFTAPGRDASPEFRQGMIIGPWLFLGGGVMFLLTGIFDSIFGLSHLMRLRRLRAQG